MSHSAAEGWGGAGRAKKSLTMQTLVSPSQSLSNTLGQQKTFQHHGAASRAVSNPDRSWWRTSRKSCFGRPWSQPSAYVLVEQVRSLSVRGVAAGRPARRMFAAFSFLEGGPGPCALHHASFERQTGYGLSTCGIRNFVVFGGR